METLYLFFVTRTTRPTKQFGDVLCILDNPGTDSDRTVSVCIGLVNVPTLLVEAVKMRILEGGSSRWKKRYLFGSNKSPVKVNAYIRKEFSDEYARVLPYFDVGTLQPIGEVPMVEWSRVRDMWWDYDAGRAATAIEMEANGAVV